MPFWILVFGTEAHEHARRNRPAHIRIGGLQTDVISSDEDRESKRLHSSASVPASCSAPSWRTA